MKILFAGYGSIARRHISNLRDIFKDRDEDLEIDLLRHVSLDKPDGIRRVFTSANSVEGKYDAVFVTTPTSKHYKTIEDLLGKAGSFFVEKPVFDRSDADITSFHNSGKMFHVACPLRFTRVLQWVRSNVELSRVISIRCISSSYLPDWRPGVDYRETYSAHADMGGGVQIDLIHELDYVCSLLGMPSAIYSIMGKVSDLEIDSNDIALYIAEFGKRTAEVHIDYFGRASIRRMELFTTEETYVCDFLKSRIQLLRQGETIDLLEERDDFQRRELEYFLNCISSGVPSDNGLEEALEVLRIAAGGGRS